MISNLIINKIRQETQNIELVIVTKNQNIQTIRRIYNYGERDFGENKVQELIVKQKILPKDIKWHMLGHLQSNKVKLIAPFIHLIQSVDSIKILNTIHKYAEKNNRIINCLLQVKISKDKNKFGLSLKETVSFFNSNYRKRYPYTTIKGIMCIGTLTTNRSTTRKEFNDMKKLHNSLPIDNPILSMGMSNDYQLAYKAGSNMIRIGSIIFNS